ncbi:hypothetical protein [Nocardia sp. NPDC058497]|uniref:hypothetical protein n=1 Tax=Nocardia sp. NPDC058497 TaxID=3346529 RepID=UPI00365B468A
MGLTLDQDAYFAETASGTYILAPSGEVTITGRTPYRMLEALAPHLDGSHTLTEVCDWLPDGHRDAVQKLVNGLVARRIVHLDESSGDIEGSGATPHGLENRILVVGGPEFCHAVAQAVATVGVVSVACVSTSAPQAELPDVDWTVTDNPWEPASIATAIRNSKATNAFGQVSLPDAPGTSECFRVFRSAGVPLAVSLLADSGIWLARDTRESPSEHIASVFLRVQSTSVRDPAGPTTSAMRPSSLLSRNIAAQLVAEVTRHDAESRLAARTARVDPATGATVLVNAIAHPFASSPDGPTAEGFTARVTELRAAERLSDAEFSQRAASLRGDAIGLFGDIDEHDYSQIPLRMCTTRVSDPMGLLRRRDQRQLTVAGWGRDVATARYRTAASALESYLSLAVDPRRLVTRGWPAELRDNRAAALDALWSGAVTAEVFGYHLIGGDVVTVDARTVFPVVDRAIDVYRTPPGVAFGYSWDDAVRTGLLRYCRGLALAGLRSGTATAVAVSPSELRSIPEAEKLIALINLLGADPAVMAISGRVAVPTFACRLGTELVSIRGAAEPAGAESIADDTGGRLMPEPV